MGLFGGIKEAKVFEGGVYFEPIVVARDAENKPVQWAPAQYVCRIDVVKTGKTRKKVDFFVVETTTLESNNPARTVGSQQSWMVMLDQDAALGNIKGFCAAATECKPEEIDEAGVEMIVSAENPLRGTILRAEAINIKTQKGNDFTVVKWRAFEATEEEKKKLVERFKEPF